MASLSAAELLDVWERGESRNAIDRALIILSANKSSAPSDPASLTIGQRNRRLLELRKDLLGNELAAVARCPRCDERVELTVGLAGLDLSASAPQPMTVAIDGRSHQIRPLDSRDLAAILDCGDVEIARRRLAELALQDWDGPLPASAVDRVAECLERADAANEILLDVACPACAYSWQVDLDVPAFVWSELEGEATRLLHEVASLARAYAWREADILAMPSGRRRFYLEAVG